MGVFFGSVFEKKKKTRIVNIVTVIVAYVSVRECVCLCARRRARESVTSQPLAALHGTRGT